VFNKATLRRIIICPNLSRPHVLFSSLLISAVVCFPSLKRSQTGMSPKKHLELSQSIQWPAPAKFGLSLWQFTCTVKSSYGLSSNRPFIRAQAQQGNPNDDQRIASSSQFVRISKKTADFPVDLKQVNWKVRCLFAPHWVFPCYSHTSGVTVQCWLLIKQEARSHFVKYDICFLVYGGLHITPVFILWYKE